MAGTNCERQLVPEGPVIIQVAPQRGENIGMVARAMANFGLVDLRLVNPRDGWANDTAQAAASKADHVIEEMYQSSPIEHAPTETTGCIVVPDQNERYACYSNTQALYFTLDNSALILNSPFHKLRLIGGTVGGGLGGKVDVITEPIAFLSCMLTRRRVKY